MMWRRRILLIDDVFTTGATIGACARALARSGARSVDVLTLARVLRPTHLDRVISSASALPATEESRL